MDAANSSGVSPYYLAARIRQEVGVNGSASIYGTYEGYEGIFNFYNIGANSGEDPIGNGLKYASNNTMGKYLLPWNDPVKAIKGGAIWIARNYIAVGQDTLYLQKFDVDNSDGTYHIEEISYHWWWTDEMFEGLSEEPEFHVYDTVKHEKSGIGTVIALDKLSSGKKCLLIEFDRWDEDFPDSHSNEIWLLYNEVTVIQSYLPN